MLRRWHVLPLILVTLAAFCGLAAAKLRTTPKYDRIHPTMTQAEVAATLGPPDGGQETSVLITEVWENDEGDTAVMYRSGPEGGEPKVVGKKITRRAPLERLAWLAGWHSTPKKIPKPTSTSAAPPAPSSGPRPIEDGGP